MKEFWLVVDSTVELARGEKCGKLWRRHLTRMSCLVFHTFNFNQEDNENICICTLRANIKKISWIVVSVRL